jgi:hypothetical protein
MSRVRERRRAVDEAVDRYRTRHSRQQTAIVIPRKPIEERTPEEWDRGVAGMVIVAADGKLRHDENCAKRVAVPFRLWSCVMVAPRPRFSGRPG